MADISLAEMVWASARGLPAWAAHRAIIESRQGKIGSSDEEILQRARDLVAESEKRALGTRALEEIDPARRWHRRGDGAMILYYVRSEFLRGFNWNGTERWTRGDSLAYLTREEAEATARDLYNVWGQKRVYGRATVVTEGQAGNEEVLLTVTAPDVQRAIETRRILPKRY